MVDIFKEHLKYDVGSIDCIVEFIQDNRKTLYKFNEDSKPFMNNLKVVDFLFHSDLIH